MEFFSNPSSRLEALDELELGLVSSLRRELTPRRFSDIHSHLVKDFDTSISVFFNFSSKVKFQMITALLVLLLIAALVAPFRLIETLGGIIAGASFQGAVE